MKNHTMLHNNNSRHVILFLVSAMNRISLISPHCLEQSSILFFLYEHLFSSTSMHLVIHLIFSILRISFFFSTLAILILLSLVFQQYAFPPFYSRSVFLLHVFSITRITSITPPAPEFLPFQFTSCLYIIKIFWILEITVSFYFQCPNINLLQIF